jgi:Sulfate permease family
VIAGRLAEVTMPGSGERFPRRLRALPVLGGLLPVDRSRLAADVAAGITLAAVSIPVALGYAKIAGMPVVTGLYTLLFPMAVFAILGSSRHLVVGADSATAAILGAAWSGTRPLAHRPMSGWPGWRPCSPEACCCWPGWPGSGSWRTSCPVPSWSDSSPVSASRWPSGSSPTCWE